LWFRRLSAALCLVVVLCGVIWFPVLLRCSFDSSRKIIFSQLQIQSMIWASTLQIRKHGHSGDFNFIILFVVGIMSLYAINSDAVSLFADSSFTFLAKLNMWLYLMYLSIWMNEYHFVCVKKNFKFSKFQQYKVFKWTS
jgi:hypothetical protein